MTVHDELVFEVPPNELEPMQHLVKEIMENVWDLEIPLKVNVKWGRNWDEAH
ncbi:MAG: DNA polymerase [Desulfobacterales bacterium]|nr:DNA polymerase [Desulfobacterales bacterium]